MISFSPSWSVAVYQAVVSLWKTKGRRREGEVAIPQEGGRSGESEKTQSQGIKPQKRNPRQLVSGRDNLESHQSTREYGGVNPPLSSARLVGSVPLAASGICPFEVGCVFISSSGLGWDWHVAPQTLQPTLPKWKRGGRGALRPQRPTTPEPGGSAPAWKVRPISIFGGD